MFCDQWKELICTIAIGKWIVSLTCLDRHQIYVSILFLWMCYTSLEETNLNFFNENYFVRTPSKSYFRQLLLKICTALRAFIVVDVPSS